MVVAVREVVSYGRCGEWVVSYGRCCEGWSVMVVVVSG